MEAHDYRLEREFVSLVDAQVLREFPFLREIVVHTPDPFDVWKITPHSSTLYAYAVAKDSTRVYYLTRLDVIDGNLRRSGVGRVVDPKTVGYLGRPAGDLKRRRKASARAAALIKGNEPQGMEWLLSLFRRRV